MGVGLREWRASEGARRPGFAGGRDRVSPRGSFEISRMNMFGLGHSLNFKSRYSTLTPRISPITGSRYRNVDGRNISLRSYDNTRDVAHLRQCDMKARCSFRRFSNAYSAWRYTSADVSVDANTEDNPLLVPLLSQLQRSNCLGERHSGPARRPDRLACGISKYGRPGLASHLSGN